MKLTLCNGCQKPRILTGVADGNSGPLPADMVKPWARFAVKKPVEVLGEDDV